MINNSLPQYTILEANSFPASTLDARIVAVCGRETTAINGARSLAVSRQKTQIVQIEEADRSIRHIFISPEQASAAIRPAAIAPERVAQKQAA
jgi:hypothetical protein